MIDVKELSLKTKDIRILYVEDEEAVREQTTMILSMLFEHIDTAFDGEDGWNKYKNGEYDAVFTDISMPRMDGLELTRRIKEQNRMQKVIIISAYNTADYLFQAIELGVDGFILKPIEMERMLITIEKLATDINNSKFIQKYHENLEKELEEKTKIIQRQLVINKLTGLQNRYALSQTLENIESEKALYIINIDNFDSINTIHGYENGNKVIRAVSQMLSTKLQKNDQLFYLDGDEFAILSDTTDCKSCERFAKELQLSIETLPIRLDINTINITASIAIAKGKNELLKHAHIALKEAKRKGKNRIQLYHENLTIEKLQEQIQTFSPIIRKAIEADSVVPFYQPIVDNRTHKISKYECLARIITQDGIYSPFHFIDVAQMIGLLPEITKIMIDKSFQKFQKNDYSFSINITEIDLNHNYLDEYFSIKLQEYQIDPKRVVLEVLEGISTIGMTKALEQLKKLQDMGSALAIDDFGAQNSNFGRVQTMNVDFIKIDGSFVKNIDKDEKSYSIVKSITEFSKSIGAEVVAEYVHSEAVQKKVEALGIEFSQGYYFGEPKQDLTVL